MRRITQRGLTIDKVEAVVSDSRAFRYYHAGAWKTGYYDAQSRVFVGSARGTIATVINNAAPRNIRNLIAAASSNRQPSQPRRDRWTP